MYSTKGRHMWFKYQVWPELNPTHISNEPGFAWDSPKEWYLNIYYKIQDISFANHSPKGMVIISEKYNLNINIIHMVDI